jgi:hypothetical protein
LWNAEVSHRTVWYTPGSLKLSWIHSTCWDNLAQGVASFSFTVQPPQRPVSIFLHWCARAACLRLSIREQWPSVSLKTWTCVPTSVHCLFSWSASCGINFHTLEGLIKFSHHLATGTYSEAAESSQHIHILFLQDTLGQKYYPPAYA